MAALEAGQMPFMIVHCQKVETCPREEKPFPPDLVKDGLWFCA